MEFIDLKTQYLNLKNEKYTKKYLIYRSKKDEYVYHRLTHVKDDLEIVPLTFRCRLTDIKKGVFFELALKK